MSELPTYTVLYSESAYGTDNAENHARALERARLHVHEVSCAAVARAEAHDEGTGTSLQLSSEEFYRAQDEALRARC